MTHQELLNDWADARFCCAAECGSITTDFPDICRKAIEYAKANGLRLPPRVSEEITEHMGWDDDNPEWQQLAAIIKEMAR
jgi:hypothetical protein